ncbi:hypothetical protein NQL31_000757 [Lotmaria passim]
MLRLSRRLAEHIPSSAEYTSPVYHHANPNSFWARRRRYFMQRGALGKFFTLVGFGAAGAGAYLATCVVVRTFHQPTVDALFTSGEDYTLEEWRTVEPTLQPGDIILMRGTGLMSWTIATLQFMFSFMHPAALRYSHVAVVVAPAVVEYMDEDQYSRHAAQPPYKVECLADVFAEEPPVTSSSSSAKALADAKVAATPTGKHSLRAQLQAEEAALRRRPVIRRGAVILEAMDNKDYDVPDVTGKVTYDTVQVVEASRRLLSTTPDNTPAYHYFSVRRLQHYEHTPERQAKMKKFCLDSEGRRMDGSLLYPLAFLSAKLHTLTHPLRSTVTDEVSCSELIVELYQNLGVVQRRWRWVPLDPSAAPSPAAMPELSSSSSSSLGEVQEVVPAPTSADVAHDRSAKSLHVYDYVYGHVNDRAGRPVIASDRPALPEASIIENGENLALPELRVRSAIAPLQPTWPEVDAIKGFSDFYGRTLTGEAEVAARNERMTRTTATYVRNPDVPSPALRAGDVATGLDGRTYQLQWYYKHNSTATCPFNFTEGAGEAVLDFATNLGLGPEIHMHIDRPGDKNRWILEDV